MPSGWRPRELGEIEAWRARVWLAQGQLALRERWQAEAGPALDQPPAPGRAAEWLALAELALANTGERGSAPPEALVAVLALAAEQAQAASRGLDALAAHALLALAQQARGDLAAARVQLCKALALAEPEGATRRLAELGAPLAELIEAALPRQARTGFARRVMLACLAQPGGRASAPAAPEPLTAREREVLALLAAGLADAEIAHALGIAVGTARWHTKRLLGKLGVANRTQAALLARERGLG
jgi:LuxR family maltose regulon positive regulatory protein